jgi:FixJ family two-component response regulator
MCRIAIVDDAASVRRSLHGRVLAAGYTVATFASAREVLDLLPRIRVVDAHMNAARPVEWHHEERCNRVKEEER